MKKFSLVIIGALIGIAMGIVSMTYPTDVEVEQPPLQDVVPSSLVGTEIKSFTYSGYGDSTETLPQNENYIIEVVGYWCDHCANLTKELSNLDVKVVQYFVKANEDNIAEFIAAHEEYPEYQILYNSTGFESEMQNYSITSIPAMIFVGSDNKIKDIHIGYETTETIQTMIDKNFTE